MRTTCSVIYFPKQSKSPKKKHPKEKCTVLEWIRNGFVFPGNPEPPLKPPASPKPRKGGV